MTYPMQKQYVPLFCCTHEEICPFANPVSNWSDISNDPTEAYYHCNLLGEEVWGEHPKCLDQLSYPDQKLALDSLRLKLKEAEEENKRLRDRLPILEKQARGLQDQTISQAGDIVRLRKDCVARFKAIGFLIASSIRDGKIELSHWRRDERLKHLQDVVGNQIKELDVRESSYADDF